MISRATDGLEGVPLLVPRGVPSEPGRDASGFDTCATGVAGATGDAVVAVDC